MRETPSRICGLSDFAPGTIRKLSRGDSVRRVGCPVIGISAAVSPVLLTAVPVSLAPQLDGAQTLPTARTALWNRNRQVNYR